MWIVAVYTGELTRAFLVTLTDEESNRGKADAKRIFDFRHGGSVLAPGRAMTGGTGGDTGVATNCIGCRVIALRTVAVLTVDAGAVTRFVAGKAAGGIIGRLHDTRSLVKIFSGLERVAGSEAKLAGCRIPTEAVLYPAATILKDRRAGVVTGTEEPVENDGPFGAALADSDASVVVGVGGAPAFSQSFALEAFAIVGLECKGVPRLGLQVHLVLMARGASEG